MGLVALVFAAALAKEAAASPREALVGPTETAAYTAWLRQDFIAREAYFSHKPACTDAVVEPVHTDAVDAPTSDPEIVSHLHYERARVSGCGRSSVQNVAVGRLAAGGWRSAAMLPGESRANLLLTIDVFQPLSSGVIASVAGCEPSGLVWGEIRVESRQRDGAWSEIWPITACGLDRTVRVAFTPSPRGGTDFSISQLPAPPRPAAK